MAAGDVERVTIHVLNWDGTPARGARIVWEHGLLSADGDGQVSVTNVAPGSSSVCGRLERQLRSSSWMRRCPMYSAASSFLRKLCSARSEKSSSSRMCGVRKK